MRKVKIVENHTDMGRIKRYWDALYRSGDRPYTLFQSFTFNLIAARVFSDRERPYVVVAESDNGTAIIPACIRKASLSLLGEELFDYRDVLADDGDALEHAWREVDRLHLPMTVKATRGEIDWAQSRPFTTAPFLPRGEKVRRIKSVERNLRLLHERGCVLMEIQESDKAQFVRRMYMLKARQRSGSLFIDPLRVEAVAALSESDLARVHALKHDEDIVAAALTFTDGSTCRFYGTYYDPRWAVFSPGICLLCRLIQLAQEQNLDFDLMTGEQSYKLRLASGVVPLFTAHRAASAMHEAVTAA
jgi:CelD/BcsL family acetyltransferase involved in cellulose biosynthesis